MEQHDSYHKRVRMLLENKDLNVRAFFLFFYKFNIIFLGS